MRAAVSMGLVARAVARVWRRGPERQRLRRGSRTEASAQVGTAWNEAIASSLRKEI